MKKILLSILLCGLSLSANAGINASNGFYLEGQAIGGSYHPPEGAAFGNFGIDLTLRPEVGYRFNDYFALEAGYTSLVNNSYPGGDNDGLGVLGPDHYRLYALDLSGKFIYPFQSGFSIFAKAGAAYTHQSVYNKTYADFELPNVDVTANRIMPLAGVGVSYNFTQNFATDISFSRYFGNDAIGNINLIGLGLSYTFNFAK